MNKNGNMKDEIYNVVLPYVLKNPKMKSTDIADSIVTDKVTTKSHRTLRRKAAEVKVAEDNYVLPSDEALIKLSDTEDEEFIDVSQVSDLLELEPSGPTVAPVVVKKSVKTPKILVLDIETARMQVGVWQINKTQYVGPDQIIKDRFMLGWAAKWLFDPKYISDFVTSQEALDRDDKRICESLWPILEETDVVITHNGLKFDLPMINTRFLKNGLNPTMPFQQIDTYKIASKLFGFSSNSLNWIGRSLLSQEKVKTNYQLWIDCENGNQTALDYMQEYCKGDVGLLEEVYLELRPWIKSHPNLGVLMDATTKICPNCGGTTFDTIGGYYTTPQNLYEAVRCSSCGAVNRLSSTLLTKEQRANIIVPAAH